MDTHYFEQSYVFLRGLTGFNTLLTPIPIVDVLLSFSLLVLDLKRLSPLLLFTLESVWILRINTPTTDYLRFLDTKLSESRDIPSLMDYLLLLFF